MKKTIILLTVMIFLAAGYSFAQDCGHCPSKSKCGVKAGEKKAEKVYVAKADDTAEKFYHKKDKCELENPVAMDLRKAVEEGYKPCPKCFPPKEDQTEDQPEEK
jgi:hypothetical protein